MEFVTTCLIISLICNLLEPIIYWLTEQLIKYRKKHKFMPKLHNTRVSKKELETWTPEQFLKEYFALDWRYTRSAKKLILKTIQFKYGGIKELEQQVYNKMAEDMKNYPYHSHLLNPSLVIQNPSLVIQHEDEDMTQEELETIDRITEKYKKEKEKINIKVD